MNYKKDLIETRLLPVRVITKANNSNGGLIAFPSGRKVILSKVDAAALLPEVYNASQRSLCEPTDIQVPNVRADSQGDHGEHEYEVPPSNYPYWWF